MYNGIITGTCIMVYTITEQQRLCLTPYYATDVWLDTSQLVQKRNNCFSLYNTDCIVI